MVLDSGTMIMVTGSETRSRVCTKLDVWAWAAQQALPDASSDTVAGKHEARRALVKWGVLIRSSSRLVLMVVVVVVVALSTASMEGYRWREEECDAASAGVASPWSESRSTIESARSSHPKMAVAHGRYSIP